MKVNESGEVNLKYIHFIIHFSQGQHLLFWWIPWVMTSLGPPQSKAARENGQWLFLQPSHEGTPHETAQMEHISSMQRITSSDKSNCSFTLAEQISAPESASTGRNELSGKTHPRSSWKLGSTLPFVESAFHRDWRDTKMGRRQRQHRSLPGSWSLGWALSEVPQESCHRITLEKQPIAQQGPAAYRICNCCDFPLNLNNSMRWNPACCSPGPLEQCEYPLGLFLFLQKSYNLLWNLDTVFAM